MSSTFFCSTRSAFRSGATYSTLLCLAVSKGSESLAESLVDVKCFLNTIYKAVCFVRRLIQLCDALLCARERKFNRIAAMCQVFSFDFQKSFSRHAQYSTALSASAEQGSGSLANLPAHVKHFLHVLRPVLCWDAFMRLIQIWVTHCAAHGNTQATVAKFTICSGQCQTFSFPGGGGDEFCSSIAQTSYISCTRHRHVLFGLPRYR